LRGRRNQPSKDYLPGITSRDHLGIEFHLSKGIGAKGDSVPNPLRNAMQIGFPQGRCGFPPEMGTPLCISALETIQPLFSSSTILA
jgi:hypothetical protein